MRNATSSPTSSSTCVIIAEPILKAIFASASQFAHLGATMGALFTLCILVTYLSLQPYGGDAAAFSGTVRCPCATSLAAYWELTLEQAMLVSDVVIMGRILELREGLRGTMNASIATMIAYKGHFAAFLMRMDDFTNFDHDAPRAMALFFFAREPAGNLALQCMTPLSSLYAVGDLKAVLDYVKDMGSGKLTHQSL